MDFGQIEAFTQVATHNSFSRAAEVLQLTQPSITARIQALERELGEELFERGGRGVKLTDAGRVFLPYVEHILQLLQEGRDAVEEVRNVQLGSLRLGSAITISTYVLPGILHRFCQEFPGVDVVIRTGRSEQVLNMLQSDEVQVGIIRSLSAPEIESIPLYDDEIVLVANPNHRFAQSGSATIGEAAREPIVLFDRGSSYYGMIHDVFRKAAVIPNVAMELDSLEATKRMVEQGLGIALVPQVTVAREVEQGTLAVVQLSDVAPIKRPISLVYRKNRKRSRTVQAFIDMMADAYARTPVA
ncbi:MAG TPA: LysR family transcriptional regulator [Dehalococcoidia bacterium]|jgi:DNA-binding transcriptional LysR family regulator|nr:LysR family transcriptional regulator [Dehalococcoidia bacterium]